MISQMHRVLLEHPVAPTEALAVTTLRAVSVYLLAQRITMSRKVSGNLRRNQRRYEQYFYRKFWTKPSFSIEQLVYVDEPLLVISSIDRNTGKNKIVLAKLYCSFQILHVTKHTRTEVANSISKRFQLI